MSISYCVGGRFANNLIQYFATKVLCRLTDKEYKYKKSFSNQKTIGDIEYINIYNKIKNEGYILQEENILLTGFYQQKEWIIPETDYIKSILNIENEDRINDTYKVSDIAKALNEYNNSIPDNTLIIHVRLDDYIHQLYNSDIIDPYSIVELVKGLEFKNNLIICDTLRYDWERKYIDILLNNIPNSKVTNNSLLTDVCIMKYAKNIVLSRSTLSWICNILSSCNEKNWFPLRNFVCNIQTLDYTNENTVQFTPKYLTYKL